MPSRGSAGWRAFCRRWKAPTRWPGSWRTPGGGRPGTWSFSTSVAGATRTSPWSRTSREAPPEQRADPRAGPAAVAGRGAVVAPRQGDAGDAVVPPQQPGLSARRGEHPRRAAPDLAGHRRPHLRRLGDVAALGKPRHLLQRAEEREHRLDPLQGRGALAVAEARRRRGRDREVDARAATVAQPAGRSRRRPSHPALAGRL